MLKFLCLVLALGASMVAANAEDTSPTSKVADLKERWQNLADNVDQINKEAANSVGDEPGQAPSNPLVTSTLVAWVSSQAEGIVEEMEAIAKYNAEGSKFSVVTYLRYLKLFDGLKVVAQQPIDELRWVKRKARVFESIYGEALNVVMAHLADLNSALTRIEDAEPKSKQVKVSKNWIKLYESIRYIASHAPKGSSLASTAIDMLKYSPSNTDDKMRSVRYQLATHAFSR